MSERKWVSPVGTSVRAAARQRAKRSAGYRREAARLAPFQRVARALILLRMDLGLTQGQLAARLGTPATVIDRLENPRVKRER